ncbi:tetratricopeptide repeat protein [Dictyobacter alpinus]|uniref:Tetratricopeptide repeat protein n=1 Tax=Dictyobacter alpinus TaxID=2014873 RepID=A0A402BES2_9CHLR|nr:helix-turn-helix domain-containing protein [Dictyobacter alpinus]GCE29931.1 tetratricopeptide repeat protein [Dictyobacter alpinus]
MPRNEKLRLQRALRNWRQQDLADQLDVTLTTIQRWERGIQEPRTYYRVKLCDLFGLPPQELGLSDDDDQPPLSVESEPDTGAAEPALSKFSVGDALWTIPYPRNPHFTGRQELLAALDQQFAPAPLVASTGIRRAALTQSQAIKGLGGIGKTQIAIEYAYHAREQQRYTHTLWINAASEETLLSGLAALKEVVPAISVHNENDQRALASEALRWLEQCQDPWLLIYDNADDLSFLPAYLPATGNGSILLTTRANSTSLMTSSLEIEPLSIEEATRLLLHRAQFEEEVTPQERVDASTIAMALGLFPLAIDQAGAYLEETGCNLQDYLTIFHQHRYELLVRRGKQASGYPDSVATTWNLSFQRVEATNPAAAEFLQLCAFLAPDQIPEELLIKGAAYWPPTLQQAVTDRFQFNQMLEALLAFSLVKRVGKTRQLSLHRLVQVVQLDRMSAEKQRQWAQRVVLAMNALFPENPAQTESWSLCQRYLDQVQACDTLIQNYQLLSPEAASLLSRAGTYLAGRAVYSLAEPLHQQALTIWQRSQETDPLPVAKQLVRLATLYYGWGKYKQAEQFYQQAFSLYKRPETQEDRGVGTAMRGLANLYNNQEKNAQAEALYLRAIDFQEQRFGPDYLEISLSLSGLGYVYVKQKNYTQAEALYSRSMHLIEKQLDPDHLDVAYSLLGLAIVYGHQERYEEAEHIYRRVLRIREKHLGPEHFLVGFVWHELAKLYQKQGKYQEAENCYRRALKIREEQLGPRHSNVVDSLNRLGNLYHEQKRYAQAEECFRHVLRINEQLQTPDPLRTSDVTLELAIMYSEQRKDEAAERHFQHALYLFEQILQLDDERLAEALYHLARFRQAQDRTQEAIELYQRALQIQQQVLGADNPITIATLQSMQEALRTAK